MSNLAKRALVAGLCAVAVGVPTAAAAAQPGVGGQSAVARAGREQTLADLRTSIRGEAFAFASYTFYAAQADREALAGVAGLFRRTAGVELNEHFRKASGMAGVVKSDAANLRTVIAGENREATAMYLMFAQQAQEDGDTSAAELFREIARDEAGHRDRFKAALRVIETGRGIIPEAPSVDTVEVPAGPPQVRSKRTLRNLDTAMRGEALAHVTYNLYAEHAEKKGNEALARLFRETARIELYEHFAGQARLAGLVGGTGDNLRKTMAGERYGATVMYPLFARRAEAAGNATVAALFRDDARDETRHADAFGRALAALGSR